VDRASCAMNGVPDESRSPLRNGDKDQRCQDGLSRRAARGGQMIEAAIEEHCQGQRERGVERIEIPGKLGPNQRRHQQRHRHPGAEHSRTALSPRQNVSSFRSRDSGMGNRNHAATPAKSHAV